MSSQDGYYSRLEWPIVGRTSLAERIAGIVLEERRPVLLEGPLGVGKTVLSRLVAEHARREQWHVEVCVATEPEATIPFGAFVRFLPSIPSGDLALTLEQAHRRVLRAAAGAPGLLLIDDIHHLDSGSLALLHRLVRAGGVSLLLTHRLGETLDASVIALQQDGLLDRIEVPPLDRASHDSALQSVLGEEWARPVAGRLWELTEGNPLFMRELVSQLVEQGIAGSTSRGVDSALEVELTPSPLLTDIVMARIAGASDRAREALDLVALAAPIRLELLLRLTDVDALAELEARRLVALVDVGQQPHLIPSHPIYGEAIRATLPALRRMQLAGQLAGVLVAGGLREPGETLQAVRWLLEANERPPPELSLRAAGEALAKSDPALAERLVYSTPGPLTANALVVLGSAQSVQNRPGGARSNLTRAREQAANDDERASAALALARHLVWMEREFHDGTVVLTEAIETTTDPAVRAELRTELAICLAVAGDAQATIRITDEVLTEPAATPRVTLSALVQSTLARTILGRYDGLSADLDRAEALASDLRAELPLALDQLGVTRALGLHFIDLSSAASAAAAGWECATVEGGAAAIWSNTIALIEMDRGRVSRSVQAARQGLTEVQVFDPFRNEQVMLSTLSLALALMGENEEAEQCAALAGPIDAMEPRTRAYADRALVWRLAANRQRAAELAVAAGERAVSGSHLTWGSLLYHDAVRLGFPDLVVEPLAGLAREATAPLVKLMARHARAASAREPRQAADVAAEFLRRSSPLFAAEAFAEAARSGPTEPARSRWRAAAAHLVTFCDGAATPPLVGLTSPLTAREQDVARLAAEGMGNRDIADHHVLSVRTVENHLASVYHKLRLSGRDELADVLPPVPS